ncbi:Hypothetical protein CINCED_3A010766 [Cinara cedri]|nr:Hypothetical protein CINCED_3A010766 [Cinara cedri]
MKKEICFICMTLVFKVITAQSNIVLTSFEDPLYAFTDNLSEEFEENDSQISSSGTSRTSRQIKIPSNYYEKFVNDSLQLHNKYRLKHGVGALVLSNKLSNNAMKWAKKMLQENKMYHQSNSLFGENLYTATGMQVTAEMPFFAWYNEGKNYDYSKEPSNLSAGHFTQCVWKNTKSMGIAIVKNKSKTFVAAEYYPPGNVIGQFRSNVLKPR